MPRQPLRHAMRFVLLIGALSLCADCAYEGSRSVVGPYLATFGVTATLVGVVTGFGELAGYALRGASGRLVDVTGQLWPVTITGYVVQMAAVPALALTHDRPSAAALIILERAARAIRNPPRDVLLSQVGRPAGGYGWVFGVHEALDQLGALGPLLVAAVLARHGSYHQAFAVLVAPALLNLGFLSLARHVYPHPRAGHLPGTGG